MKQTILNLKKKLLLIELPEGAKDIEISTLGDIIFKTSGTKEVVWLEDDRAVRKCIGKLTDISLGSEFNLLDAKESFFSKLQAGEIYFENPLGKKPHLGMFIEQRGNCVEDYDKAFKEWQEAQQKVWNINQCYLFEILN